MFVVAGITGQTGAAVARGLLSKGERVRGIVREARRARDWAARGVELVEGELSDAGALTRAFAGATGAYMLAPPRPEHPDPIASYAAVAEATRTAAAKAGLDRLVFLSSEGAHLPSGTGPITGLHQAEQILSGALPRLTFLRATYFQENWKAVLGAAVHEGVLPTMLSRLDHKRAMVATADIGQAAVDVLLHDNPPALVELAGPQDYSPRDVAAALSIGLSREVVPIVPPREAWTGILEQAGLGSAYAQLLAEMYDGINAGHVRFSGEGEAWRGTTTLQETLASWSDQTAVLMVQKGAA